VSLVVWFFVVVVFLFIAMGIYLATVLKWEDEQTVGKNYYGKPLAERERFKRTLARHASLLSPMLWLNGRLTTLDFKRARIQYKGVSGPAGSCSVESFQRAESYQPRPEDVFVVTQMKCGTTWMQQVIYEILHRGRGQLVDTGAAMYAVSTWLEGRKSVRIEDAPLIGSERPSRIIKTHLPVALCPYDPAARFIYVARHPGSCFASCVDFVQTNVGAMSPDMRAFEEWFCSKDLMWWGTWTDHVLGWYRWSTEQKNVLFLYFEDMKKDLPGIVQVVAGFLGMSLTDEEVASVAEKSSFRYMQDHQSSFEMQPPHILQSRARLFVSGSADRHKDVPNEVRLRISSWAARELSDTTFPLAQKYPDVAAAS
jgi:sulfotransferase family protein